MAKIKRRSAWRGAALICTAMLCACFASVLAGCQTDTNSTDNTGTTTTETDSNATRTFVDSCGRSVEVPAHIDRIASSGPLAQQVLLTIAPNKMVGLSTKISDDQAKYLGPNYASMDIFGQIYGGKGDFNKEAVAAADPQVIIDIGEAKKTISEDMDQLQEATGIPCVHIESTLSTYDQAYTMLGDLLGEEDSAATLANYCRHAYDDTKAALDKIPASDRIKGAYLLGDDGLHAIAKGSYQGTVIDMTYDNVVEVEKASGSGQGNEISLEQISLWDPDFIVFSSGSIYSSVADDAAWSDLTAIKTKNYCEAPGSPYNWLSGPPSVNQVLGMQWLPRVVYPNAFDNDLQQVVTEYYHLFYHYDLSQADYDTLMTNALPKK